MPLNRRSALTPAWNGTIKVIGLVGKSLALAKAGTKIPASNTTAADVQFAAKRRMTVLPCVSLGLCTPMFGWIRRLRQLRIRRPHCAWQGDADKPGCTRAAG